MNLLKTLSFSLLAASCVLSASLFFGVSPEIKTFGISGSINFEGHSPKGAQVVFTTSDANPFEIGVDQPRHEELLLTDGKFYRKLTKAGGEDIHLWIKKDGYPVINVRRVLNFNDGIIDFGEITVPSKLVLDQSEPISFYKDKCSEETATTVTPSQIKVLRNFSVVNCEHQSVEQYHAQVEIYPTLAPASSSTTSSVKTETSRRLAYVFF